MLKCQKCNFINAGNQPKRCTRCGRLFVYRDRYGRGCSVDDRNDDIAGIVILGSVTERDRWNEEENRPNTFVEDAMKDGRSGGGGASASFDAPERQDDPDPPSDDNDTDTGSSDSGSDD